MYLFRWTEFLKVQLKNIDNGISFRFHDEHKIEIFI